MKSGWRRYLADPLCWWGIAAYLVNSLLLKDWAMTSSPFVHGHLNDLLLIPCALPPLLFVYRCLGLRTHDRPPTWKEIGLHLGLWSLFFEFIGPIYFHKGTGDTWDVLSYALGAGAAGVIWRLGADLEARQPSFRRMNQLQPTT